MIEPVEIATFVPMDSHAVEALDFELYQLPFRQTGYFSDLILDYIDGNSRLKKFYGRPPQLAHFAAQANEKAAHYAHRVALLEALKRQYAAAKLPITAVEPLAKPTAFTITTGHQVCLFTGPVYFIYKIATAIKTCRMLAEAHPALQFVPVFWMATEDHDFEEANHFGLPQGSLSWESGQGGAVGRMSTEGMADVAAELKSILGLGYHAAELEKLFEDAYLKHDNVAAATRFLVHSLFHAYGVVCVDGDDPALKRLAIPAFEKELFQQMAKHAVEVTSADLSAHYAIQAHPRDINLFYLGDQFRERIVYKDGQWHVLNSQLTFSEKSLRDELHNHPERFSPNVILRPLYQEIILPNLAYIGGGGELAYWFQLKGMFDDFQIPFPVLMLRNSAMVIGKEESVLMEQVGITAIDLFTNTMELEKTLLKRDSPQALELDEARDALDALYGQVEQRLVAVDATLTRSVKSGYTRSDKILQALEKKLLRAERRKQQVLMNRLKKLRDKLFPGGGLQERKWNFATYYHPYGPGFIETLVQQFDPFNGQFSVLKERE